MNKLKIRNANYVAQHRLKRQLAGKCIYCAKSNDNKPKRYCKDCAIKALIKYYKKIINESLAKPDRQSQ